MPLYIRRLADTRVALASAAAFGATNIYLLLI